MATFTRVWDATYKSLPEDDDDSLEGAARIRHMRTDIPERMEVDHYWAGTSHDGKHKKVTLKMQAADPALDAGDIALYSKAVGSANELFFKSASGIITQLTFTTGEPQTVPSGEVSAHAGNTIPTGYLECNGAAVLRSAFPALFLAIGTIYGAGDGTTTFNVPNITGRTIFGKEAAESRITTAIAGFSGGTMGAAGGSQSLQGHTHTANVSDPGHSHSYNTIGGSTNHSINDIPLPNTPTGATTGASTTGIGVTINSTGAGTSGNVPPGIVMKWKIKT